MNSVASDMEPEIDETHLVCLKTYLKRLVDFILLWYSKAIVLVKYNGTNIRFLAAVHCSERLGDWNREMIEIRYGSMRQT